MTVSLTVERYVPIFGVVIYLQLLIAIRVQEALAPFLLAMSKNLLVRLVCFLNLCLNFAAFLPLYSNDAHIILILLYDSNFQIRGDFLCLKDMSQSSIIKSSLIANSLTDLQGTNPLNKPSLSQCQMLISQPDLIGSPFLKPTTSSPQMRISYQLCCRGPKLHDSICILHS